ncbi:MAG: hypothetical protein DRP79_08150 [Planctomycetota bacterium]|nr:MAG: hypothetical protein DRP79_08150 [Planctomycetota bacterium]
MAKKKKFKRNARDKRPDVLVDYGEKFLYFARKNSVLITVVILAVVAGVIIIYKSVHDAHAAELRAGDEMQAKLRAISATKQAAKAQLLIEELQNLREKNKNRKIYPRMTLLYGRACYELGLRFGRDEFLASAEEAFSELLDRFPDSAVAKLKNPSTGENLIAFLREEVRKDRREFASPEMEANFDPDDIYTPEEPEEKTENE